MQVNRVNERWHRILLLDDDPAKHGTTRLGLPIVGGFERLQEADPSTDEVVNLVTRTTAGRASAREKIAAHGIAFASLVHPGVDLLGAELEDDVTVYANSCIGAESKLARSCVVLVGAVVGHGTHVSEGCIIAPNAVINARVSLGDQVYVGSNASILPDLRIGAGATIAANTLVVGDVPAGATALGVPATIAQVVERDRLEPAAPPAARFSGQHDRCRLEAEISAAIGRVLVLAEVPRGANFFDLGGTSLKAVQLSQHFNDHLGLPAHPLDLFRFPSVAALAQRFAGSRPATPAVQAAQQRAALRRALQRR
ncbi:MAG: hexapeptide repeat-containing transferase [Acidimicrobiaceae bacterium]|nr:MAG: hexapeptide repeat-containing transferase [Acidimicrobiaceae bacterium]